jgi:hypothetical protein
MILIVDVLECVLEYFVLGFDTSRQEEEPWP